MRFWTLNLELRPEIIDKAHVLSKIPPFILLEPTVDFYSRFFASSFLPPETVRYLELTGNREK